MTEATTPPARGRSGRLLAGGLVAFAAFFGLVLWWFTVFAYYRTVDGLVFVEVSGRPVPVVGYRGIDADSSPLKMRGCFRLDPASLPDAPEAEAPAPLIAPFWFGCFDADAIGADLEAGRARAVVAERDAPPGFVRIVVVYPDGRAYQWRQVAADAS
jgi:hypothetical protein